MLLLAAGWLSVSGLAGCGGGETPVTTADADAAAAPAASGSEATSADSPGTTSGPGGRPIQPITLGGGTATVSGGTTDSAAPLSEEQKKEDARQALKPLQVVVGQWRGTARRKNSEGFNFTDEFEWRWDFSDGGKPALLMKGSGSTYFEEARITWLPEEQEFELTAVDSDGAERKYRGELTEPVRREPGEDKRTHTTFRLTFNQVEPADDRKLVRVELKQQQNDRYLLTVFNGGGANPRLYDTVAGQREGTSFAKADDDYGDRECIVSQGLGTISLSHEGKTYYVCCSGCKAAFEEDPERWIAKAAAREKTKN